jgi:hypothetical protein
MTAVRMGSRFDQPGKIRRLLIIYPEGISADSPAKVYSKFEIITADALTLSNRANHLADESR